jgi:hypothetical protein
MPGKVQISRSQPFGKRQMKFHDKREEKSKNVEKLLWQAFLTPKPNPSGREKKKTKPVKKKTTTKNEAASPIFHHHN